MSATSRWLALLFVGASGAAASAQAPAMVGAPLYPPPHYPAPPLYYPPQRAVPAYYPPPQPRVMYVPATPVDWSVGAAPMATAGSVATRPATGPVVMSGATDAVAPGEGGAAVRSEVQSSPAVVASLRKDLEWQEGVPESCGKSKGTCAPPVAASHPWHERHHAPADDCANWLPKGHCTLQILGGAYADLSSAKYNWGQGVIRFGRVCDGECLSCVPGAFEILAEATAAANYSSDFGNHFYGGGLLLRYNFVNLGSRVVPYAQIGVGFQVNDASRDNDVQAYLGSPIELTGQAGVGLRVFLCKSLTLDFEGGIQRLTNCNMSTRDDGITALGGSLGVTYFLPRKY